MTKKTSRRRLGTNPEFVRWAEHALAGVNQSGMMLAVLDQDQKGARLEFMIQIGHCLLEGKPLVFVAPRGATLPEKLQAAASHIAYYDPDNQVSLEAAVREVCDAVGRPVQH